MKFKTPNKEFIKICIDRLTRFKPIGEKYKRVFDDILNKHLIFDGVKLSDMEDEVKIPLAVKIFNSAFSCPSSFKLNEIIKNDEESIFYITEEEKKYLNSKIDFEKALELFNENELPLNLKKLKLQKDKTSKQVREEFGVLYPVSKVVLVEGITEEILLIEFAKAAGLDFKKEGIYVLGAGGKNQVARKYYKLIEEIKIPIFVLLDEDAGETFNLISPKLREIDKIYKINSGEFEDLLPKNLIKNALNMHFHENMPVIDNQFDETGHAVDELSTCYRNNGWGDFKKANFAKIVKDYLVSTKNPPISDELQIIIDEIKSI